MTGVGDSFTRTSGQNRVTARGNVTLISGQAKTTAVGAGGGAVSITNVSGTIPVSVAGVKVSGNKLDVNIAGVNTSGGKILTTAAGGGTNVAITNVSGDVRVTSAGLPLTVSAAGVAVVSGAIKTTAVGAGGAAVAITNVSGQVRVTAGDLPLPVNITQTSAQIHVTAGNANLPTLASISGDVRVTAGNAVLPVLASISGDVKVTAGDAILPVLASISGQAKVTAGNSPLPVLASISGQAKVTAADSPLPTIASISGDVRITAAGAPVPVTVNNAAVSQNAPGAWEIASRGDAVFNALVSNPVKYGKLAQVAGAVCADIVAGVAGRKIRVLGGYFNATGTATAIFMTTGASAALTPKIVMNAGFVLPVTKYGYFETAAGSALSLQIEGGSVGGIITYQEVF